MQDPVVYPGLYSATGFDIMSILVRGSFFKDTVVSWLTIFPQLQVMSRPYPKIELGPVDCSVAVIVCDLQQADCPIVYASESFCELTGYGTNEVLGRNCRFLQTPPGKMANAADAIKSVDRAAIHRMRQAVQTRSELQLNVTNYKKNGERFTNALSIIPVMPQGSDYRYAVGFQVEL